MRVFILQDGIDDLEIKQCMNICWVSMQANEPIMPTIYKYLDHHCQESPFALAMVTMLPKRYEALCPYNLNSNTLRSFHSLAGRFV